jgi:hypothetical protein
MLEQLGILLAVGAPDPYEWKVRIGALCRLILFR